MGSKSSRSSNKHHFPGGGGDASESPLKGRRQAKKTRILFPIVIGGIAGCLVPFVLYAIAQPGNAFLLSGTVILAILLYLFRGALPHLRGRHWLSIAVYVAMLYGMLFLELATFLTGRPNFLSAMSHWVWDAAAFPSSMVPYAVGALGGNGDLAELLFFAVPLINGCVVAIVLGKVIGWKQRRRLAPEEDGIRQDTIDV